VFDPSSNGEGGGAGLKKTQNGKNPTPVWVSPSSLSSSSSSSYPSSVSKVQTYLDGHLKVIQQDGRVSYSSQLGGSGDLSPVGGGNPPSRITDTQPLNNPRSWTYPPR